MKLVKHPDTFLRGSTEKIEFPLSEENKIIIKNMINLMYRRIYDIAGITDKSISVSLNDEKIKHI